MSKLFGLVVCGGQSSRMGTDKSILEYHNMPQRYYIYSILNFCDNVFLSCNTNQAASIDASYNVIIDDSQYSNIGPMAALLSAYSKFPEASFLLVGCDYPFVDSKVLKKLIQNRSNETDAICYFNPKTNFEEPLLAIYENSCLSNIVKNFVVGNYSLRHFLKSVNTKKIIPEFLESLTSVDTIKDFEKALIKLNENSGK